MAEQAIDFEKVAEDDRAEVWEASTDRALSDKTLAEVAKLFKGQTIETIARSPHNSTIAVRVQKKEA